MARKIDILVLSDLHLGTKQCRAGRLLKYLKSVKPSTIILNGDIVDLWLLNLKKWPAKHTKILAYFFNLMTKGVPIYYLPGNHDDYFKKYDGFHFQNFKVTNELVLELNGQKTCFMHGDKYDKSVSGRKRNLAIRAGKAFDVLVGLNRYINDWEKFFGKKEYSNFSKMLKDKSKKAVLKKYDFEQDYIEEAIENEVQNLVCGHFHRPGITTMCSIKHQKELSYLNSGDWTESCTALEYNEGEWHLYKYKYGYTQHQSTIKNMNFNQDDINPFLKD